MSNDLQADLTADLLRDLSLPATPPTAAAAGAAGAAAGAGASPAETGQPTAAAPMRPGTPALSVTLTPLQWSAPSVRRAGGGTGVAVRLGPWRVEVGF